jgi:4'-phosphopantetheinyl transferase
VTQEADIGIDVEWMNRSLNPTTLTNQVLLPEEAGALQALPLSDRRSRFFDYWTLKEAYIKSRGIGLSLPLREFRFIFRDDAGLQVAFQPSLADAPSSWQFFLMTPTTDHRLALAVRSILGQDMKPHIIHVRSADGENAETDLPP